MRGEICLFLHVDKQDGEKTCRKMCEKNTEKEKQND